MHSMSAMLRASFVVLVLVSFTAGEYPVTYTTCGVDHTLQQSPSRVVTMNQGVTEFMLAMGLKDKMVGTAYIDDEIWPRYKSAYATIPVLSTSYPSETEIMAVTPDFILGSYKSAFRERTCTTERCRGIFNVSTGPCEGLGSDWFKGGSTSAAKPHSYSTCRPQLHAKGIGTWLEPVSCEDNALKPAEATEETVYAAIRQIGQIFNVRTVAEQLVSEIKNDFDIAAESVRELKSGIKAVWLDCVGCCKDDAGNKLKDQVFIGAGKGAPNLIMKEAGLTNVFAKEQGSWACVNISRIVEAQPDVMVVVDAAWDTAMEKIQFMHNDSTFCTAHFVQRAEYVTIPFSASTLGPRNGVAALDMLSAAIHLTTGSVTMNFESGVSFLKTDLLQNRTAGLLCPYKPPVKKESSSSDHLSDGAIAGIVIGSLCGACLLATVIFLIVRERQGYPVFMPLISDDPDFPPQTTQVTSKNPDTIGYEVPAPAAPDQPMGLQIA
jgi:iron complex transport system substrate-binding protein